MTEERFADLPVAESTKRALAEVFGYELMTKVQAKTIAPCLSGRDVVAMETAILPGDEELIAAMTMANPDARRWFWGMSGPVHTSNCRGAS